MDRSLVVRYGARRLLISAIVALSLVMTLGASPVAVASPGSCRVRDLDSGRTYNRLQAAVRAARTGDRLAVRGTCIGRTVISKNLTIVGIRTKRSGEPRLSGADQVRVLDIRKGARVTIRRLVVVQGRALRGGGIRNYGTLVLSNVRVRRCTAPSTPTANGHGGGIYDAGRLFLDGKTRVLASGASFGGGVYNTGTLVMRGNSSIQRNNGDGVGNRGTLVMKEHSTVKANTTFDSPSGVTNLGTFVMHGQSRVADNRSGRHAPAIAISLGGSLTMNGSASINGNAGPAVELRDGTFTMNAASSITGTYASAAVTVEGGRFAMGGSSVITRNRLRGLYYTGGTLVGVRCAPEPLANVYDNADGDCFGPGFE